MKRLIFICGLHRSGTSLLEHYLYTNYEICALRANVPENEGQFLQEVYQPAYKYGGPGKFAFSQKMQDDLMALDQFRNYQTQMMKSWKQHLVGEGNFLLEKSPPNITKIWWLKQVFPNAIFIIWTRDPRAVSGATQKWSNTSLEELMQHWSTAYAIAIKDMSNDMIVLKYEDFCQSPEMTISKTELKNLLVKRKEPYKMQKRFINLKNTNETYYRLFDNKIILGGTWQKFGYNF